MRKFIQCLTMTAVMAFAFTAVGALPQDWVDLSSSVDVAKEGTYRLTWKVRSKTAPGRVYVDGRRVNAERMSSPLEDEGGPFRRVESEPVSLRPGVGIVAFARPAVSEVRLSTAHDEAYWEWTFERNLDSESAFASLRDCALKPGELTVSVEQRLAKPESAKVVAVVYDYWQNEKCRFEKDVVIDGCHRSVLRYPLGDGDSHRAYITVAFSGNRVARRYLTCSTPCAEGYHKRLPLMKGWECVWSNRLGVQRAAVTMPDDRRVDPKTRESIYDREYRLKLFIPREFRGERYRFGFASAGIDNALCVNGRKAPDFDSVLIHHPQSVDITELLDPDATNDLRLVCSARARTETQYAGSDEFWPQLVMDPWIESHPALSIGEAPRIRTSWREKTIEVLPQKIPAGCRISHRVLRCGREVVPSFSGKVRWKNPIAWGPGRDPEGIGSLDDFPLLELESTLRNASGKVCDVRRTRFGFREFWTEGMHFLWNGKKFAGCGRAMIPRYGTAGRQNEQFVLDELELCSRQANRFRRHAREMQFFYDFCDELGIVTSVSSAYCPAGQISAVLRDNPAYWANKRKSDIAMTKAYGNHPSVFTWYLTNEFWGYTPEGQKLLHPLIRALKEEDPDHFVECGCDLDVGGVTDTVSTHYPASDLADPATFMPDRIYWRPLDKEFSVGCHVPFGQVKTVANTRGDSLITWGVRPISAHETGWDHYLDYPNNPTRIWGEDAYNGAGNVARMHWLYNREYYVGHRDAGCYQIVDWMHPFSGSQPFVLPVADVAVVQRYHHFYAGEKVRYDVNVFHDRLAKEDVTFAWKVVDTAGNAAAKGRRIFSADWCENFRAEISFTAPAPGNYTLVYGTSPGPVKRMRLTVSPRADSITTAANLVTADMKLDEALLKRAESGETIVVLAREDYPSFLPVSLDVTRRVASVNFSFRRGHPVLAGIPEKDWSYWYPLHRTGSGYFNKPASGCARTILEAGGPMGLAYSGLIEVPVGKGCFLFSRLDLDVESQRRNPIARRLLQNMLAYRAPRKEPGVLGLVGFANDAMLKLHKFGVVCEPYRKGGKYAAIYVDGSRTPPGDVPALGVPVIVRDPSKAWGVGRGKLDESDRRGRAVKLPAAEREPLLAGLTNFDLFLRQKSSVFVETLHFTDPKSALAEVGTGRITGGVPLTYPEVLAKGEGVLFESLNWLESSPSVQGKLERAITTIIANAGVRIEAPRRLSVPDGLYYWPVDLSRYLNRGLVDEVDNDGVGGCSDQGPEYDFRHWRPKAGVQDLGGIDWDIRLPNAMLALSSRWRKRGNAYSSVEIPLSGRKFDWLFLLHTSSWTMNFHNFSLFVDYVDGRTHEIRFEGGVNMRGAEVEDPDAPFLEEFETLTKRVVTFKQQRFGQASLYSTAWRNPNPKTAARAVRIVSAEMSVPMIFALTLGDENLDERKCDKQRCDRLAAEASRLLRAGKTSEAYAMYRAANRAHPGELYVYKELVECARAEGDFNAALEWCERSLKVNGNQPPIWKLRSEIRERMGLK